MSWVGWRRPKAPRGQQPRGYSDRTSMRSRHLVGARVVWEAKRDKKTGFATAFIFFEAPWAVYSVLGVVGPRAAAVPVALPLEIGGARL